MGRYTIILLFAIVVAVNSQKSLFHRLETLLNDEWMAFKLAFNKNYANAADENIRREIFIENRRKIARFNQEYERGQHTFFQSVNPYADLLHHEFNNQLNGFNRTAPRRIISTPSTYIPSANVVYPDYMDWREVGAVTSVKSQGMCAGCWAFSAVGALEGQNFRKTGTLVELSPQNLIDCTRGYDNEGCAGGRVSPAFEYVKNNPGIDTEAGYPYEGRDGPCRFRSDAVGGVCTGYVELAEGDESGLEAAIATLGPVSAVMDAGKDSLQFYAGGVYYEPTCSNNAEEMNHAVLVVGYGTEPNGQKYWLVKNSYGNRWGIEGYMKIAKDFNNHCGIATQASYPLV